MYAIMITLRALPGRGDELVRVSRATVEPSRAEPGCLFFDLLRAEGSPDEIVFYESYRSQADFEAHLATAHVRAWQAEALPMIDRASIRMPSHRSVLSDSAE
jgi:quinol monooxygenase YgiN